MSKTNYFEGIIGQDQAKRELSFWLDSYQKTGYMPHLGIFGEKGNGKSHIAKAIAKNLVDLKTRLPKKAKVINSATVKSVGQLVEEVFLPNDGAPVTYFFDEAHSLPKVGVTPALLTILEPNKRRQTSFSYDGMVLDFDFTQVSFIFATTEPHLMFHALKDRMEKIELEHYSVEELGKILALNLGDEVTVDPTILPDIASYIRQNGRAAYKMAEKIKALGAKAFGKTEWQSLKDHLGLVWKGLSRHEIMMLKVLAECGEMSEQHLASRLGMPSQVLRRDVQVYPMRLGLVTIDGKRKISQEGRNYLIEIGELSR